MRQQRTAKEISEIYGVTERTAYRWLADNDARTIDHTDYDALHREQRRAERLKEIRKQVRNCVEEMSDCLLDIKETLDPSEPELPVWASELRGEIEPMYKALDKFARASTLFDENELSYDADGNKKPLPPDEEDQEDGE